MDIFLETPRLRLTIPEPSDFNDLYALRSDPDVMKYLGGIQSKEKVKASLEKAIQYHKKNRLGFCSVFEKASGSFVGQAGLFHLRHDDIQLDIEIGYRLHKASWGKGYGMELLKALVHYGFENLPVNRLVLVIDPGNTRSEKMSEKCGFHYAGKMDYYGEKLPYYEIYKSDLKEIY